MGWAALPRELRLNEGTEDPGDARILNESETAQRGLGVKHSPELLLAGGENCSVRARVPYTRCWDVPGCCCVGDAPGFVLSGGCSKPGPVEELQMFAGSGAFKGGFIIPCLEPAPFRVKWLFSR